jgi:hypothetical protein
MNVKGNEDLQKLKSKNNDQKSFTSPLPLVLKVGRYLPVLILLGLAVHLILPRSPLLKNPFR